MNENLVVQCAGIDDLPRVWELCTEMAQLMDYPSYFCSGSWLRTAYETLLIKNNFIVLIVKYNDSPRAILPLITKRNILGGNDLFFLGYDYNPDPLGLICAGDDIYTCIEVLKPTLFNLCNSDRLFLNWVLEDEALAWDAPKRLVSLAPYIKLPFSFDDLLKGFTRKKRNDLRRKVRKFFDEGGEFVISSGKKSHLEFLDTLFMIQQKRVEEKNLVNSFCGHRVELFHKKLIENSSNIRFYGLNFNNRLISVIYGYEFANIFFYFQIAHDPDFGKLGPGSVLLFLTIEDCCKRGIREFNFLQGNELYKSSWTNTSRKLYRCIINKGNFRSKVISKLDEGKFWLKNRLSRY